MGAIFSSKFSYIPHVYFYLRYVYFSDFYIFLIGEESLKFGGVNFQRTESGRFINKNGQELSNDAMAASKFLL